MQKNLNQILETLQKLIGLHRQLLETVRLERQALTDADLSGIQEATFAKEALVASIRIQETRRLQVTAEIAFILKRPLKELKLADLIVAVQVQEPKLSEQLRSALNALTILISHIREQNESNRALVERSLDHVSEMKRNVLGEQNPMRDTYTQHGQKSKNSGGSRLLSREA